MAITQAMCTSFKKELLEAKHNFLNSGGSTFKIALSSYPANLLLKPSSSILLSAYALNSDFSFPRSLLELNIFMVFWNQIMNKLIDI